MAEVFPPKIGAPAARALAAAGITSYDELARRTAADLQALHGMGPKALAVLRDALAARDAPAARNADRPSPAPTDAAVDGPVDAYLAGLAPEPQACLAAVRRTLRTILPHAEEGLRYAMPAMVLDGTGVAGYAAFRDHCGYFPLSGKVLEAAGDAVAGYRHSKGGIRFGFDERLPVALVRRLVELRLAELAAVDDGTRREYDRNGRLKAVGPMKQGELHGAWRWYRGDGTLLRTGRFAHGEKVGTWTTWDRDGNAAKITTVPARRR